MKRIYLYVTIVLFTAIHVIGGENNARKDGLIFYNNFDKAPFVAEFAVGTRQSFLPAGIKLKTIPGIKNRAVIVGRDLSSLKYIGFKTADNISLKEGSISFWVQPQDWDGTTKGSILLLGAAAPDNSGFRVYKFSTPGYLWFLSGKKDKQNGKTLTREIIKNIKSWKKKQWHHIAVTWRKGGKVFFGKEQRFRIYVDGKLSQGKQLEESKFPVKLPAKFYIGPQRRWGKDVVVHTAIDELKIYNRELTAAEIKTEYLSLYRPKSVRNILSAGKMPNSPVVNGEIIDSVWKDITKYNIFFNKYGRYASELKEPSVSLGYDNKYLFVSVKENIQGLNLKTKAKKKDSAVYRDDSYEIFIGNAKEPNTYRHYIINSKGVVYDAAEKNKSWNGNVIVKSNIKNDYWNLKIAIPFSDLGITTPSNTTKLTFNLSRNYFRKSGQWTAVSICDVRGYFHKPETFAKLLLLPAKESIAVLMENPLLKEAVDLKIKAYKGCTVSNKILENGKLVDTFNKKITTKYASYKYILDRGAKSKQYCLKTEIVAPNKKTIFSQQTVFNVIPHVLVYSEFDLKKEMINFKLIPASLSERTKLTSKIKVVFEFSKDSKIIKTLRRAYKQKISFPQRNLPSESCLLQCSFITPGGKTLYKSYYNYYYINYNAWKNYSGGLNDNIVPTPWVPATYKNNAFTCLSRKYVIGKRALPDALIEKGENILCKDGVKLIAIRDGNRYDLSNFKLSTKSITPAKIVLTGSGKIANCKIKATVEIEFDGYCVTDFKITGNTNFDQLYLQFPFTKSTSQLKFIPFMNERPVVKSDVGLLENYLSRRFGPGLWIGNDKKGMTFFTESNEFYFLKDPLKTYELIKNKQGEASLRVNFISDNRRIPRKLRYKFGYQVTPVKPFPKPENWLSYGLVCGQNNKLYITGFGNILDNNYQGFPGNDGCKFGKQYNDAAKRTVVKFKSGKNRYGCQLMPVRYLNPTMCPITVPEFDSFRKYWIVEPNNVWGTDGPDNVPSYRVTPNAQSWVNFFCYRFNRYFQNIKENGLYSDFAHPILDSNPLTNSGYVKNGKRYPTYCIYKYHEMQKRLYIIAKKYETPDRPIFFVGHSGGTYPLPHGNFWQMVVDPEYLGGVISAEKPTLDFITPGRIRAEYNGRQFGTILNFIPIREGKFRKYTDDTMTMLVSAGLLWWNHTFLLKDRQNDVYRAYKKLGMTGVKQFLPFWNNKEYVKISDPNVLCTILGKPNKKLISVCNFSVKTKSVRMVLNLHKLGFKEKVKVCNAANDKPVKMSENGELKVTLSGRNFIMLFIQSEN